VEQQGQSHRLLADNGREGVEGVLHDGGVARRSRITRSRCVKDHPDFPETRTAPPMPEHGTLG
jgi:hypothetical protein